jgi:hypothetical protein
VGYGDTRASDRNVPFDYDGALAAARDLWVLAAAVRAHQAERSDAADAARDGWLGSLRDTFDVKAGTEDIDAAHLAAAIEGTAMELARAWARSRGEQDRINDARWRDHDEANRHDGEFVLVEYTHKLADGVAGIFGNGTDYGPPPDDPPAPGPPNFEPTRPPVRPEFERR